MSFNLRALLEEMIQKEASDLHITTGERPKTVLTDSLAEVTIDDIIAAGVDSADSDAFRSVFFATKPVDDEYYDLIRDICEKTNATQCQS